MGRTIRWAWGVTGCDLVAGDGRRMPADAPSVAHLSPVESTKIVWVHLKYDTSESTFTQG
jgi:hypothetical protein